MVVLSQSAYHSWKIGLDDISGPLQSPQETPLLSHAARKVQARSPDGRGLKDELPVGLRRRLAGLEHDTSQGIAPSAP